jgi:PhnB protein
MSAIIPYLNFTGNCREAMNFYKDALKGDLNIITHGDMDPNTPPANKDRVMHASLSLEKGKSVLMASDAWEGMQFSMGNAFSVSVHPTSAEETKRVWAALSEGAKVGQPLADAPWGALYGALTDKFGVQWMFNYEYPKQ